MQLQVNLDEAEICDWELSLANAIKDEVTMCLRREIRALVKSHKSVIETTAKGIIREALLEIQSTQKEALAAKVSDLFKKEVMKV